MDVYCTKHKDAEVLHFHCTAPHTACPIAAHGPAVVSECPCNTAVDVLIECARCMEKNFIKYTGIPMGLVNTAVICFHASHEGHALRTTIGSCIIESPGWEETREKTIQAASEARGNITVDRELIRQMRLEELRSVIKK